MLFYTKSVDKVFAELDSTNIGLSDTEAQERLAHYGPNVITVHGEPLWRKIIEPFRSVFMGVLFLAVIISFFYQAVFDAVIILIIISISAGIYYVQRFSTERILRSLQAHTKLVVRVYRKGIVTEIDAIALVPGDIILLEEGDKVPADARLVQVQSLRVDESQLTGESLAITKNIDTLAADKEIYEQSNMVFQGSFIIGGTAQAIVTLTGNNTEFGRLAELSAEAVEASPVQKKIDRLISSIIAVVVALAIVAFGLSIYRGIELADALRFVIALSVSAVPEGLPIAISVVLVLGMRRMAARRALVRTMSAIESVGTVTTIATDKTGTLTKNKLSVQEVWHPHANQAAALHTMSRATLGLRTETKAHDPLDTAFGEYAAAHHEVVSHPEIHAYQFTQALAMSGALYHHGHTLELYIKGSPEQVIQRSDLTENEREQAHARLHHMTGLGYRVVALAHTTLPKEIESLELLPKGERFEFDGLVAIADILRPEARAAIRTAQRAGITVRMITGDHFETAYHIGKQIGLVTRREEVFDSRRMSHMTDDKLEEELVTARVFSRVIPEHKHRILAILKRHNITAMTGDGVNDVPALTNAHVGIAMGTGAQIAKDAGDIILLDNNFRSIISAIHEGRTIYANIKRMLVYLLSTSLGEVLVSIGSLVIGLPLPLLPVQILWINLVTDSAMVIPLGLEPGEKRNMNRPPQASDAPLLSRFMISRIVILAGTMAAITLSLYASYNAAYGHDYARTVAFCSLVAMQWASALCMRSDYEPLWRRLAKPNLPFYIGLAIAIVLQTLAVFGPLQAMLSAAPIAVGDLAYISLVSITVLIAVVELHKWIGRAFFNKGYQAEPR
ncbi:MAG TPA: cation-transporting P-type ATPase [Candidatus Saccharimonas sp.]|mgnify:CR=1 FL=1|nr:cation-transporting P-type ATPase [Candidatus Saccharimonas sp.]